MTREEAERLAKVLATADGGCPVCVHSICEKANDAQLGWWFFFKENSLPMRDEVFALATEEEYLAAKAKEEA